ALAAGVILFASLAAWWVGPFSLKTADGWIVLDEVPKGATIFVDGDKINVRWPGIGVPLEIRAVPGQRRVEVKKDGFKVFGQVVTVASDGSEELKVRLEPLVEKASREAPKPSPPVTALAPASSRTLELVALESMTLKGHGDRAKESTFSPDGSRIVSASWDSTAKVWDALTGQEILTFKGHSQRVNGVAFSPDGREAVSTSGDHTAKIWDAATGQERLTLKGHRDNLIGVAFSPDGRKVATASNDLTAKVWDTATGRELLSLEGHALGLADVAFSPDGQKIATAGGDKTVKIWDAATGLLRQTLEGHAKEVRSVSFSPEGRRIVSASWDGLVKVCDLATGRAALELNGNADQVGGAVFSPDGRRIASAHWNKTVKLWDAETGQPLLTLEGHTDAVICVAFSPDGRRIASASGDGTVKVWELTTRQLPATPTAAQGLDGQFTPLFNGKDLTGWWLESPREWRVTDDGRLVVASLQADSHLTAILNTHRRDFKNYRLRFEALNVDGIRKAVFFRFLRTETYNSYIASFGGTKHPQEGYEEPVGSLRVFVDQDPGSRVDFWDVKAKPVPVPIHEWQTMEITAIKNRITTSVDGQVVAEFTDERGGLGAGAIRFVCPAGASTELKDIRIQELSDSGEPVTREDAPAAEIGTPEIVKATPAARAASQPDRRRIWVVKKDHWFENQEGNRWRENGEGGTVFHWVEIGRNEQFVELYDGSRGGGGYLRLAEGQGQIRWTERREAFRHFRTGTWAANAPSSR
ncbi:family 16 glycoside hydrolase, partial [Singulisphaera rosea]